MKRIILLITVLALISILFCLGASHINAQSEQDIETVNPQNIDSDNQEQASDIADTDINDFTYIGNTKKSLLSDDKSNITEESKPFVEESEEEEGSVEAQKIDEQELAGSTPDQSIEENNMYVTRQPQWDNPSLGIPITILKQDEEGKSLEGAKFKVFDSQGEQLKIYSMDFPDNGITKEDLVDWRFPLCRFQNNKGNLSYLVSQDVKYNVDESNSEKTYVSSLNELVDNLEESSNIAKNFINQLGIGFNPVESISVDLEGVSFIFHPKKVDGVCLLEASDNTYYILLGFAETLSFVEDVVPEGYISQDDPMSLEIKHWEMADVYISIENEVELQDFITHITKVFSLSDDAITIAKNEDEAINFAKNYANLDDSDNDVATAKITNVSNTATTNILVAKVWLDGGGGRIGNTQSMPVSYYRYAQNGEYNLESKRPESITIRLFRNGVEIDSTTVQTLEDLQIEFADLPIYDENGERIIYTIKEDPVPNYTSIVVLLEDELSNKWYGMLNIYNPNLNIPVKKSWIDNNESGKRPNVVTVKLLADGEDTGKTLVLSEANNWKDDFIDLDKYNFDYLEDYTIEEINELLINLSDSRNVLYNDKNKITYTVEEVEVEGYTSTITGDAESGFTITNEKTSTPPEPTTTETTGPSKPTDPTTTKPTEPTYPPVPTETVNPIVPIYPSKPVMQPVPRTVQETTEIRIPNKQINSTKLHKETEPIKLPKTGEEGLISFWFGLTSFTLGSFLLILRNKNRVK